MKVYVLCVQLGSRGDCMYEQVFASADAAMKYVELEDLVWGLCPEYGFFCSNWFQEFDIKARWVILEEEVLK